MTVFYKLGSFLIKKLICAWGWVKALETCNILNTFLECNILLLWTFYVIVCIFKESNGKFRTAMDLVTGTQLWVIDAVLMEILFASCMVTMLFIQAELISILKILSKDFHVVYKPRFIWSAIKIHRMTPKRVRFQVSMPLHFWLEETFCTQMLACK